MAETKEDANSRLPTSPSPTDLKQNYQVRVNIFLWSRLSHPLPQDQVITYRKK